MKRILLSLVITAFLSALVKAEYIYEEMFKLSWGGDSVQAPYTIDPEGIIRGPSQVYVDNEENVYFAFFSKDFRKYNSSGQLMYSKDLYIDEFAVDDSLRVYFTEFDKTHTVRVLNNEGNITEKQYQHKFNNDLQSVLWIKEIGGSLFLGYSNKTMQVLDNSLITANGIYHKPFDKYGIYYDCETSMRKATRAKSSSYNKNYLNIYRFSYSDANYIWLDTLKLEICRSPHQAAEILHIDYNNNYYIWVFYGFDEPIDLIVIDSIYQEIDRIVLPIKIESMGTSIIRPFVSPNGNVYEFRCLDDGLHVIRWAKEE